MEENSHDELTQIFIEESGSLIERFDSGLIELEKEKHADLIKEQLRILHTLKGNAAGMGVHRMEHCAHELEALLVSEQSREDAISEDTMKQLLQGSDSLQDFLKEYGEDIKNITNPSQKDREFNITLHFHRQNSNAELEAIQLVALLRSMGDVLSVQPPIESLDEITTLKIHFRGELTADQIYDRLHDPDAYKLEIVSLHKKEHPTSSKSSQDSFSADTIENIILRASSVDSQLHSHIEQLKHCLRSLNDDYHGLFEVLRNLKMAPRGNESLDTIYEGIFNTVRMSYQKQKNILIKHQYSAMGITGFIQRLMISLVRARMIPMNHIFDRFKRIVRDTASGLGKKVELSCSGGGTSIDRDMSENVSGMLTHCIRNAIDHGIELPEERKKKGKKEIGKISIQAQSDGESVTIRISDDGKGIDLEKIRKRAAEANLLKDKTYSEEELYEFLFMPGFSTRSELSELSGRGIGLDVVQSSIRSLRGRVDINSQRSVGTTINVYFPVTLVLMNGFLVRSQKNYYVFPVKNVQRSYRSADLADAKTHAAKIRVHSSKELSYTTIEELLGGKSNEDSLRPYLLQTTFNSYTGLVGIDEILGSESFSVQSTHDLHIPGIGGTCMTNTSDIALLVNL